MSEIRWKLWQAASWVAYWLCPDKKALAFVMKHGTDASRSAMNQVRAAKEGKR